MEAGALRAPAGLARISVAGSLLRLRSDEQLVAIFRTGNDAAFRVIHDRYRQRLLAYTRQMLGGSAQDAEDALQDVFLRAYNALRADDRPLSLRAWLYRVAHNRCIDQLRRPAPPPLELLETARAATPDALAEAQQRDDLRRLVEDVRRLPGQQRSALLMREMDGLTYTEMSDALEVTVPAVKSLLVRARLGLVEAVEARDTACGEIRDDLASASERGVRASGRTRRHLRDCPGCRDYRSQLRVLRSGFGALAPPPPGPLGALAKVIGLGGAGSGAAASAGGAAGGGAVVALSGGTAAKVAAVVSAAALTAGGAVEVRERIGAPPAPNAQRPAEPPPASPAIVGSAAAAAAPDALLARAPSPVAGGAGDAGTAEPRGETRDRGLDAGRAGRDRGDQAISPHVLAPTASSPDAARTGGTIAPDEQAPDGQERTSVLPLIGGLLGRDEGSAPPKDGTSSSGAAGTSGTSTPE